MFPPVPMCRCWPKVPPKTIPRARPGRGQRDYYGTNLPRPLNARLVKTRIAGNLPAPNASSHGITCQNHEPRQTHPPLVNEVETRQNWILSTKAIEVASVNCDRMVVTSGGKFDINSLAKAIGESNQLEELTAFYPLLIWVICVSAF